MAFSSITGDTSWQDLTIALQIRVAYNKRRTACGLSTMSTPDQSVTVWDFVRACQDGIEEMATMWGDKDTAITSGETSLPNNFTSIGAMFTAAGLTGSNGWRRIAEGGSQPDPWTDYGAAGWSYGKITDKDLAGPWLFQDLMTALQGLTRIIKDDYSVSHYASDYKHVEYTDETPPTAHLTIDGSPSLTSTAGAKAPQINCIKGKQYTGCEFVADIECWVDLSRVVCGTGAAVSGVSRTFTALSLVRYGASEFSAVSALGVSTNDRTVAKASDSSGYAWWPFSPLDTIPTWQAIANCIDNGWDGGVEMYTGLALEFYSTTAGFRCVTDYTFIDGATS